MSQIYSIISSPWMIKPLFGFLTDLFPICGYRRKIYIFFVSFLIMFSWLTLSFHTKTLFEATTLLTLVNVGLSFSTVLGEAIVVELSQLEEDKSKVNEKAKNYVSLFFATKYTGVLFSSYLKGLFVELMHVRKVFLIASIVPTLIFVSGVVFLENKAGNCDKDNLDEETTPLSNSENKNKEIIENNGDQSIIVDRSILLEDKKNEVKPNHQLENSIEKKGKEEIDKGEMVLDFFKFLGQKYVFVPTIFLVIFMATPSYSDPFFYFLTDVLKFKATQLGKIAFCSTLATLLSIFFYRYYLKNTNFKSIIIICSLLAFLFNFFAYLVVTRYNLKLGINDFWLCLVSNSLLAGLGELILMPMLALACQLCPKNLEGTVYSFFMSALNFGGIMSGLNGSFLTSVLGITSKNFDNLPNLILISNVISLLPLFLLCCIDNAYFHPEMNKEAETSNNSEKKKEEKTEDNSHNTANNLNANEENKIKNDQENSQKESNTNKISSDNNTK